MSRKSKKFCAICNCYLFNFNVHLKKCHNLTREEYAFKVKNDEIFVCEFCKEEFYFSYEQQRLYNKLNHKNKTCGKKECITKKKILVAKSKETSDKRIKNSIKKYGTKHPMQSKAVQKKYKETCFSRFGVENPTKVESVRKKISNTVSSIQCQEKTKSTIVDKYGCVKTYRDKLQTKTMKTCLKKYGKSNPWAAKEIRSKIEKTNEKKYGYKNPYQFKHNRSKLYLKETQLKKHETMKRNGTYGKSAPEDFLYQLMCRKLPLSWNILRQQNVKFTRNDKEDNLCVDFLVEAKGEKIVILVDSYWHGLGRTEDEIRKFKTPRDKTILKTLLKDRAFNQWAVQNNVNVLRFNCVLINSIKNKLIPYFENGNKIIGNSIINKLNDANFDLFK